MSKTIPESLSNIQYLSSGKFVSHGEWMHPRRIIDSYEIILMLQGTAYIQEEDTTYTLQPGDLLILQPDKLHFGFATSNGETSFYWVHFFDIDGYLIQHSAPYIHIDDAFHLHLLCRQLLHLANTPIYPGHATHLILWLIVTEVISKQKETFERTSPLIKEISEWIRIHADRILTVQEVAARFGYNEDYLTRLFRNHYSIGIKEYIGETRMNRIKQFLLMTSYPTKRIAMEAGFDNYKNFLKYFKYHEGISPTKFRNVYYHTKMNKQ
jgi:AraC-like DNA-binding protein